MQYVNHQQACCDLLSRHHGKTPTKGLQEISFLHVIAHRNVELVPGQEICTPCRKEVSSCTNIVQNEEPAPAPLHESDMETDRSYEHESIESSFADVSLVNDSIGSLGELPVKAKKLVRNKRYSEEKLK